MNMVRDRSIDVSRFHNSVGCLFRPEDTQIGNREVAPNQWPVGLHKTQHPTYWNLTEISWFECSPDEVDLLVYAVGQFDAVTRFDYQLLDPRTDQATLDRIVWPLVGAATNYPSLTDPRTRRRSE